jgi:hypothetical protein
MDKEWFEDEKRKPKWPSVEDATGRINVVIDTMKEDGVGVAARDLIVLMRELGRVTAEGARQYEENVNQIAKYAALEEENHRLTAELKALKLQVSFDRRMREYLAACKSDALAKEPDMKK